MEGSSLERQKRKPDGKLADQSCEESCAERKEFVKKMKKPATPTGFVPLRLLAGRSDGSSFIALAVDKIEDFLSMNGDFFRSDYAEPNFVAADFHDCHSDVVIDDDAFVAFSRKY